jgi:hypothetical protein
LAGTQLPKGSSVKVKWGLAITPGESLAGLLSDPLLQQVQDDFASVVAAEIPS